LRVCLIENLNRKSYPVCLSDDCPDLDGFQCDLCVVFWCFSRYRFDCFPFAAMASSPLKISTAFKIVLHFQGHRRCCTIAETFGRFLLRYLEESTATSEVEVGEFDLFQRKDLTPFFRIRQTLQHGTSVDYDDHWSNFLLQKRSRWPCAEMMLCMRASADACRGGHRFNPHLRPYTMVEILHQLRSTPLAFLQASGQFDVN
jgi:hypothetical protein